MIITIEIIHQYIDGTLGAEDKKQFEQQLATDARLRGQVDTERILLEGIRRKALSAKANKGFKSYRTIKALKLAAIAIVSVAVMGAAAYYVVSKQHASESTNYELPELNEDGTKHWADADKNLPTQLFEIDNARDTVVETDKGIVMAVPANCFLDKSGKAVTGPVQLELREALDAADIMKAGLSTMSGDKLLETGGMFYINARQDGEQLKFNTGKSILTEVPTDKVKPGMQVFDGKRQPDGSIDWVQPKPLETFLVPVDILSLNFYPPEYEDSLAAWGYDVGNKVFKDSLYYSFIYNMPAPASEDDLIITEHADTAVSGESRQDYLARGKTIFNANCAVCHSTTHVKLTGPGLAGVFDRVPKPADSWLKRYILNNFELIKSGDAYANKIYKENGYAQMTAFSGLISDHDMDALLAYMKDPDGAPHEVSPAKIKAIWDPKFNNTILATKEFEERLKYIHYSNRNDLLDLYVNNLDKRLSYIDSLALRDAACLEKTFAEFAARGDGRVKNDDMQVKKLQAYYQTKAEAYAQAIQKTQKAFWDKQNSLRDKALEEEASHSEREGNRVSKTFAEEFDLNLTEVYKQLGLKKTRINAQPAGTYQVAVSSMGWKNIDAYVFEATVNRESTTITYQGKTAQIRYEPISLKINGADDYDVTYAYLMPDQLSSYTRMSRDKDRFSEKLNGFIKYDLVCLAYKNDEIYFYKSVDVKPGDLGNIGLTKISKTELEQQLNAMSHGTVKDDVSEDYRYAKFMVKEQKRQKQLSDILALRTKAEAVIFKSKCGYSAETRAALK